MSNIATVPKPFIKPVHLVDTGKMGGALKALSGIGSLNINVKRYYTDTAGIQLDKTSILIPASLKVSLPVFLLGNFDRIGAYNLGQKTLPNIVRSAIFLMTYVHGYDQPFLWNTGSNTVAANFKKGDIITVFTDDLNNPSAFAWIVQTCDYGALASIISNTMTQQDDGTIGFMKVQQIKYQVNNDANSDTARTAQLGEVWQILTMDNLGQFKQHPYSPIINKDPYFKTSSDFLQLDFSFVLTQYIAINFMMQYTTDLIQVNFTIQKP